MARILGIDYGKVRVGIAVSDPLQLIANGLTTIKNEEIFSFLTNYIKKEEVETIVVGIPKRLNNTHTDITQEVLNFIEKLKIQFPGQQVYKVDERFTSKLAGEAILQSGIKKEKRKNKSLVDEVSATIILQSYLQQKENKFKNK